MRQLVVELEFHNAKTGKLTCKDTFINKLNYPLGDFFWFVPMYLAHT